MKLTPAMENLLEWAKEAAENERAHYPEYDPDFPPPSWLAELEDAISKVEDELKD